MANQYTKRAAAAAKTTRKKAPTHHAHASMAVTAAEPINTTDLGASLVALFRQHGIEVHGVEFSEPVRISTTSLNDKAALTPSVQTEPEVPSGLDRIEGALNHLHSVVELVEKRLAPVMRSDPPAAGNGTGAGEAPAEQSNVGQRLRSLESRIWQAGVVLHSINRRLEV